ncbi:MAG: TlpA family protein disulfide reductase [Planctomycetes bacterium]|nr:TlpA family protein disulfide reductase [Planctomycetota bacterium]
MRSQTSLRLFPRLTARSLYRSATVTLGLLFVGVTISTAADAPAPPQPKAVLHLTNDGFIAGDFAGGANPGAVRWQSAAFTAPFEFRLNNISTVQFPAPAKLPVPTGDWCFELDQGTILYGSLRSWTKDEIEIDATHIGQVKLKAPLVHRIYRVRDNGDIVYLGPTGLAGWQLTPATGVWREDFGHLAAAQEGSAFGDFGMPARAAIEFEISWKKRPDFVLALGVGADPQTSKRAFRFEVWADDLVINRELDQKVDLQGVQSIQGGPGRAHLQAFIDQEKGHCLVFSASGQKLAEIQIPPAKPEVLSGIRLDNIRGDVRLERLRITRWTGALPREVAADQPRLHRTDGNIEYGKVTAYDPATKEFVMSRDAGDLRVPFDQVDSAFLSFPAEGQLPVVRVGYHDGLHVAGDLQRIADDGLWMTTPAIAGPVRLPRNGLRSIIMLQAESLTDGDGPDPIGTLELEGTRLRGRLVEGNPGPGATCLAWQPVGSEAMANLRAGVSGRIVYREPPPPAKKTNASTAQGAAVRLQAIRVLGQPAAGQPQAAKPTGKGGGQPSLYLLTGDTIPCEVTKIDETGVTFKTAVADSGFVPHEKIKAVELVRDSTNAPGLTVNKRNRLLTLPRMQRENPPTHLLRSKNGDYLRCRLVSMDENNVQVEVRLESRTIPRDRIIRIIWLHGEDLEGGGEKESPRAEAQAADTRDGRVQVLRSDGIRLTFVPEKFSASTLSGNSEILGACHVAMKQIDQLLIGSAIEEAAAQLAYQKWKLQNALDPKYVQEDAASGEGAGTDSVLVGKPAPAFELDLLQGGRFKLAEAKGKVVVLDFWATWCGPCLMAMPQVDRATRAFANDGVQLIAVNLEEAPKPIKAMLERHKLDMTVALDKDGAVAAKYQASSIPQTVIIDQEGVVARVFVGATPQLEEQIREALQKLLPDAKPAAADPAAP